MVKCLPAMQEMWVQSLGQEDPLEKEMAAHSSILAWEIPWTEEPGRLQFIGSQESDTTTKQQLKTTKGHLDCFQVWAVMNKAAININVQVCVWACLQLL